jgi:hypothetical protein
MNLLEYQLNQAVKCLKEAGIDYALLGGIAVSIYSAPRMTQDIDINIVLNMEDTAEFLRKARKYGFRPIPTDINKFIKETGVIPMKFSKRGIIGRFDFIIAQNPIEFAGIQRARFKKIYGVKLKIVTAEDLLLHKLLSDRPIDREDARGILLRQGKKLDMRYITAWLKKIAKSSFARRLLKEFEELVKNAKVIYKRG